MDEPQQGPSEVIPENSSELHLEERCNRLLRTLAQCRPRFRVSCTLCNNMTPSDHRTTHLVHFLRHHTTESDDKDQLFAFVGISDSDTYNRSWQQGRNKIAKRKAAMVKGNNRNKHNSALREEVDNYQVPVAGTSARNSHRQSVIVTIQSGPGEASDQQDSQANLSAVQAEFSAVNRDESTENKVQITSSEALNLTQTHSSSPSASPSSSNDNSSTLNHNICNSHPGTMLNGNSAVEKSSHSSTRPSEASQSPGINPTPVPPLKNENSFLRRLLCSERSEPPAILASALNLPQISSKPPSQVSQVATIKRKRGRPRKYFTTSEMVSSNGGNSSGVDAPVFRRKRGRPRKYPPGFTRASESSKNSNVTIKYTHTGEPIVCRKRGRPPKNQNANKLLAAGNKAVHSQSSKEPCIQTRFMTEKARELFLKQCEVSFHSERTKRQIRLEEKKRRLNVLVSMEQKLHWQLASELESDVKSDSESSYSSSDEDVPPTSDSNLSLTMKKLKSPAKSSPKTLDPLNLVPTTLPGIFFTNPSISIEVLPPKKTPGRPSRRHT